MSTSSSSSTSLLLSLASVGIFGYSAYFMNFHRKYSEMAQEGDNSANMSKLATLLPAPLRAFGQLKFLTYQCLLIQLVSSILHVLAHFSRSLIPARDLFFTCFAYPVGSIVVYTFWGVWHIMGREMIFPATLSQFYPDWLNHSTHSIIAPLNILLLFMVNHKYKKNAVAYTLIYFGSYVSFLLYIKHKSGHFVYRYLETYGPLELTIYFSGTALLAYLMYKSGQLISGLVHEKASQRPQLKKSKQK